MVSSTECAAWSQPTGEGNTGTECGATCPRRTVGRAIGTDRGGRCQQPTEGKISKAEETVAEVYSPGASDTDDVYDAYNGHGGCDEDGTYRDIIR